MLENLPALLLPGAVGLMLWRLCVAPRLAPSDGGDPGLAGRSEVDDPGQHPSNPALLLLFLLGWLGIQLLALGAQAILQLDLDELGLRGMLALQTGATLGGVAFVLLLARRRHGGLGALGLRGARPGLTLLAALAGWLAFLPLLELCAQLNAAALRWVGEPVVVQDYLSRFGAEGGASSPGVWLAIGVVLPVCEELLFRGALFGGLRGALHPGGAMLLSGLVFGAAHAPAVILPVTALGVLLAWLYARTGSLAAPCLVHILQNTTTLIVSTYWPELSP